MEFQLLIKCKIVINKDISSFKLSDIAFILLINVKMLTVVGILTYIRMIEFIFSSIAHETVS